MGFDTKMISVSMTGLTTASFNNFALEYNTYKLDLTPMSTQFDGGGLKPTLFGNDIDARTLVITAAALLSVL